MYDADTTFSFDGDGHAAFGYRIMPALMMGMFSLIFFVSRVDVIYIAGQTSDFPESQHIIKGDTFYYLLQNL